MAGIAKGGARLDPGDGFTPATMDRGGDGDFTFVPTGGGTVPPDIAFLISQGAGGGGGAGTPWAPRRPQMGMGGGSGSVHRQPIPSYGQGGSHPGGWAWVGEHGPELALLPPGTSIIPSMSPGMGMGKSAESQRGSKPGRMRRKGKGKGKAVPAYANGTPDAYEDPSALYDTHGKFSGPAFSQNLTSQMFGAGLFNPFGSTATAEQAGQNVLQHSGAQQEASAHAADLYAGGDPALRAYFRGQAQLNNTSQASQAYSDARMRSTWENQDFLHGLYANQFAPAYTRRDPREPNALAQGVGSLAGSALGAWMGGMPTARPHPLADPGQGGTY